MLLAKNEIDRDMKGGMTTRRRCRTTSEDRAGREIEKVHAGRPTDSLVNRQKGETVERWSAEKCVRER